MTESVYENKHASLFFSMIENYDACEIALDPITGSDHCWNSFAPNSIHLQDEFAVYFAAFHHVCSTHHFSPHQGHSVGTTVLAICRDVSFAV